MVCAALLTLPEIKIVPQSVLARSFHSVSDSVPALLLPNMILQRPPAFQKYRAASADAKVMVCVNVMVQAVEPEPVALVLLVVPLKVPMVVPDAAALPLLVVELVKSVLSAARILIVLPATGATRLVIEVPW